MELRDIHGSPIDPIWAAEFRGFFWADGYMGIHQVHRKYRGKRITHLRPSLKISQRNDNRAILEAFQARLGGYITTNPGRQVRDIRGNARFTRPMACWEVHTTEGVRRAISLLCDGILPHNKQAQLKVMQEYLSMRHAPGHKYTSEEKERMEALRQEMVSLHQYVNS